MKSLEFFGGFIELNLCSLSLCNFLLKLCSFSRYFNGELLNLEGEFLDLCLISASILLESQVIFFLLSGSERPLFQFLLVPIHLKFELIHFLIGFEDLILNVVKAILLVSNPLLKFFYLILQTSTLSLCDLFKVLFSFNLFIFSVNKTLSVNELHLN